jgi:membrane protein
MRYLGFIWRVLRRLVWETATDNTTGLAAQMAYLLLFALAPGTLFLWHLVGLFGTDPTKLHRMFVLLKSFLPPDPQGKVQDILDSAMASVVVTGSSGLLAKAGIILGIYFGTVFIATVSRALSQMHGVREDRHWWSKYIISFFMLFWFGIVIVTSFNAIVFGEKLAGIAEVNFQLSLQAWIATLTLPFTAVALVFLALALYLYTPENYLTVRQALPGAIFFAVGWIIATKLFQLYVERYDRYNPTYLALASIIMLLTWMYLTCVLLLLGGKLNAILRRERERMRRAAPVAPTPAVRPA